MCAAIAGKTGIVDGACNEVKSWTVTLTTDMLDATDFCSAGWREFVEGLKGATVSITSTERFVGSSSVSLSNSVGGVTVAGDVLWDSETITNEVDGIQEYENTGTFTGAVTVT